MAEEDDYDLESRPSRPVSAMAIEFEPDLEAPLLASVGAKPQSRLAPLLVLLAFIIIVILLASLMGSLSLRRHDFKNATPITFGDSNMLTWGIFLVLCQVYSYRDGHEGSVRTNQHRKKELCD